MTGLKLPVIPAGGVSSERVSVPVKLVRVTVTLVLPLRPAWMLSVGGLRVSTTLGAAVTVSPKVVLALPTPVALPATVAV